MQQFCLFDLVHVYLVCHNGEVHRQRACKNRALRGIIWFKRKKDGGNWITCVIGTFVLYNSQQISCQ